MGTTSGAGSAYPSGAPLANQMPVYFGQIIFALSNKHLILINLTLSKSVKIPKR
jgi:hypothetical protein